MESITNKANENGILIKNGKIVIRKDNNLSFTAFRESVTRNINEYNKTEKKEKLTFIHQNIAEPLSKQDHPFVQFNNKSKCYDVLPIDSKLLKIIRGYFRFLANKNNSSEETIISKKSTKQPNVTSTRTVKSPLTNDVKFRNGYRTPCINEIIDHHTATMGKTPLYKIILDYINTVLDENHNFFKYNKKEERYVLIVLKSEKKKKLLAKKIAGPATRTEPIREGSEGPSKKDVRIHNGEHNKDKEDDSREEEGGTEKYNHLINQHLQKYYSIEGQPKWEFLLEQVVEVLLEDGRKFFLYNEETKCYDRILLDNDNFKKGFTQSKVTQKMRDTKDKQKVDSVNIPNGDDVDQTLQADYLEVESSQLVKEVEDTTSCTIPQDEKADSTSSITIGTQSSNKKRKYDYAEPSSSASPIFPGIDACIELGTDDAGLMSLY